MAAELKLGTGATPSTPAAGLATFFVGTDLQPKVLDEKGVQSGLASRELCNYVRNSGMWFAQRQAPGTLTTYSNTTGRSISADGWGVTNSTASVQYIRTDSVAGSESGLTAQYYGTWSKITNAGKVVLSQVVEHRDALHTRNRVVRLQVWLKASTNTTMKLAVVQNNVSAVADTIAATYIAAFGANGDDPTLGTNLAFCVPVSGVSGDNCTQDTNSYQCEVTKAWKRFGGVFTIPPDAKNVIVQVWTDNSMAIADTFSMSQVSLTDGYEIQAWAPLSWTLELQRCQRFYMKSFLPDTLPATAIGLSLGEQDGVTGKAGAVANSGFIIMRYPVTMLKSPTLVLFNPVSGNALARNITGVADMGATSTGNPSVNGFFTNSTGVAATAVGDIIAIHYTADAEI